MAEAEWDDINEAIVSNIPTYERITFMVNSSLLFYGSTIEEWITQTQLPVFKDDFSIDELESFSAEFINKSDLIMTNLGRARASFGFAKLQYSRRMSQAKDAILEDRREQSQRAPGMELLDSLARNLSLDAYSTLKIAEIMLDFWKGTHEKLRLIDSRLTGIGILKNVESRYAVRG